MCNTLTYLKIQLPLINQVLNQIMDLIISKEDKWTTFPSTLSMLYHTIATPLTIKVEDRMHAFALACLLNLGRNLSSGHEIWAAEPGEALGKKTGAWRSQCLPLGYEMGRPTLEPRAHMYIHNFIVDSFTFFFRVIKEGRDRKIIWYEPTVAETSWVWNAKGSIGWWIGHWVV